MDIINQATGLLDSLYGLPRDLLLAGFAIVVGWVLKTQNWFNNQRIPLAVIALCTIGSPILSFGTYNHSQAMTPQVLAHVMVGAIVGFLAWGFHNKILSRVEDKIPFLGGLLADSSQAPSTPATNNKDNTVKIPLWIMACGLTSLLAAGQAQAQFGQAAPTVTNATTIIDYVTAGSNYFAVPFATYSIGDHSFGGGVAIGYKITDVVAPMVRFEEFAKDWWNVSAQATLQPPRQLFGKFPVIPFAVAGVGTPMSGDESGKLISIVGGGLVFNLDFFGDAWLLKHSWLAADYEYWAGMPDRQTDQIRFGFGLSF